MSDRICLDCGGLSPFHRNGCNLYRWRIPSSAEPAIPTPSQPELKPASSDTAGELERGADIIKRLAKFFSGTGSAEARQHIGRIAGDMRDAAAELRELHRVARLSQRCIENFLPSPDGPDPEHEDEHRAVSRVKQALHAVIGEPQ